MTYRYRYLTTLQLAPVLDLVLADRIESARAVGFKSTDGACPNTSKARAARDESDVVRTSEQKLILSAQASLRLADVESFLHGERRFGDRRQLDKFLSHLASELRALSDSISHTYLTHTVDSRQLDAQLLAPTSSLTSDFR